MWPWSEISELKSQLRKTDDEKMRVQRELRELRRVFYSDPVSIFYRAPIVEKYTDATTIEVATMLAAGKVKTAKEALQCIVLNIATADAHAAMRRQPEPEEDTDDA